MHFPVIKIQRRLQFGIIQIAKDTHAGELSLTEYSGIDQRKHQLSSVKGRLYHILSNTTKIKLLRSTELLQLILKNNDPNKTGQRKN